MIQPGKPVIAGMIVGGRAQASVVGLITRRPRVQITPPLLSFRKVASSQDETETPGRFGASEASKHESRQPATDQQVSAAFSPGSGKAELVESWRPCPGFESFYDVSDLGRVRRSAPGTNTEPGRIVKVVARHDGYLQVHLTAGPARSSKAVHCLVALAFLGPRPFPGAQVNHKDGDKPNCRLTNLEYVSASENVRHAISTGLLQPHLNVIRHCSRCGALGHYVTGCFDVDALADEINALELAP